MDSGSSSLSDLTPTMVSGSPTEADVLIGLVASSADAVSDLDGPSASLLRQLATDLVGDDDLVLGRLLDDDDIYVREKAELKLRPRTDAAARQLLNTYTSRYDAFAERCREILQRAGWNVSRDPPEENTSITWRALTIGEPGGRVGLSLGMFYARRRHADFDAWLTQRVQALKKAKT